MIDTSFPPTAMMLRQTTGTPLSWWFHPTHISGLTFTPSSSLPTPPDSPSHLHPSTVLMRSLPFTFSASPKTLHLPSINFKKRPSRPKLSSQINTATADPPGLTTGIPYADRIVELGITLLLLFTITTISTPLFNNPSLYQFCAYAGTSVFLIASTVVYVVEWCRSASRDFWCLWEVETPKALETLVAPPSPELTDSAWEDGASPAMKRVPKFEQRVHDESNGWEGKSNLTWGDAIRSKECITSTSLT